MSGAMEAESYHPGGTHWPGNRRFDGRDANALHWLALTLEEEPVSTLRLLPSGQIGRAAVLPAYRGRGVGSRLLRHAIALAPCPLMALAVDLGVELRPGHRADMIGVDRATDLQVLGRRHVATVGWCSAWVPHV